MRYYLSVQKKDLERARRVGDVLDLGADPTDPKLTHSGQKSGCSERGGWKYRCVKPSASKGYESAPGVTRTPDLRFRKPPLYPPELRAQVL